MILKTQLKKWVEGLNKVNNVPIVIEETPDTAIEKFYMTIDFISEDVLKFVEDFDYESTESEKIVEQLKTLLVNSVTELVKYSSYVKVFI